MGSPGPDVTSASGAKSAVKPSPRSSAPLAAYACSVSAASPAAPALMKVGNRLAAPRSRSTTPPSWSTPRNSGHFRRTWRVRAVLTPLIWSADATFELKAITPPRWRSRTSATGARVPLQSATITWPARSGRRIRPTIFAARSSSRAVRAPALGQPQRLRGGGRDRRRAAGRGAARVPLLLRRRLLAAARSGRRDQGEGRDQRGQAGGHPVMVARAPDASQPATPPVAGVTCRGARASPTASRTPATQPLRPPGVRRARRGRPAPTTALRRRGRPPASGRGRRSR